MINKREYKINNNRKILHKVGKQWKVISVAFLFAIAGGAVVTAHANASQVQSSNSQPQAVSNAPKAIQSQATGLHAKLLTTAPKASSSTSSAPSSSSSISASSSVSAKSASATPKSSSISSESSFAPKTSSTNRSASSQSVASSSSADGSTADTATTAQNAHHIDGNTTVERDIAVNYFLKGDYNKTAPSKITNTGINQLDQAGGVPNGYVINLNDPVYEQGTNKFGKYVDVNITTPPKPVPMNYFINGDYVKTAPVKLSDIFNIQSDWQVEHNLQSLYHEDPKKLGIPDNYVIDDHSFRTGSNKWGDYVDEDLTLNDPNEQMAKANSALINGKNNQNFHFNNPEGQSNDIEAIIPHYDKNYKIDYWDIYYLWNTKSQVAEDQWGHAIANKDFSDIEPADKNDPLSIKNVVIPDPDYSVKGAKGVEIAPSDNVPIPWGQVAGGSVISNLKPDDTAWVTNDEWGNPIASTAQLAFFATYHSKKMANGENIGNYLAYANPDGKGGYQQFRPYSSDDVFDSTTIGEPINEDGRDPYVTNNGNKLVAYLAGGSTGNVFEIESSDAVHWHDAGKVNLFGVMNKLGLGDEKGIETPHVSVISGQPILFWSAQDGNHEVNQGMYYATGHFDNNGLFQLDANSKCGSVDAGYDNYAGNFQNIDADHLIYVGWLGNWYTYDGVHDSGFSLPRVLTWNGQYLESTPVDPGALVGSDTVKGQPNVYQDNGRVDMYFHNPRTSFQIKVERANGADNQPSYINVNFDNGTLSLGRDNSADGEATMTKKIKVPTNTLNGARFYLDNDSVEMYLPDVHQVYSLLDFSNSDNAPYKFDILPPNTQTVSYQFDNKQPKQSQPKATINYVDFLTGKTIHTNYAPISDHDIYYNQFQVPNGYHLAIDGDDENPEGTSAETEAHNYNYLPSLATHGHDETYNIPVIPSDTINNGYFGTAKYEVNNKGQMTIANGKFNTGKYSSGIVDGLGYRNNVKSIRFDNVDMSGMTNLHGLFRNDPKLSDINFGKTFDTSNATDMSYMFASDPSLKYIVLPSSFTTNKVIDMSNMFHYDQNLINMDVSNFDTHNVKYMQGMFSSDYNIEAINLGDHFDMSNVKDEWGFFHGSKKLNKVYIPKVANFKNDRGSFDTPFMDNQVSSDGVYSTGRIEKLGNQNSQWYYSAKVYEVCYSRDGNLFLNPDGLAKVYDYIAIPLIPDADYHGSMNIARQAQDVEHKLTIPKHTYLVPDDRQDYKPVSWGGIILKVNTVDATDSIDFVDQNKQVVSPNGKINVNPYKNVVIMTGKYGKPFHVKAPKGFTINGNGIMYYNDNHYDVPVIGDPVHTTAKLHLVYNETNGKVDKTSDVSLPISARVGDTVKVSPWKYSRSHYNNKNTIWVIPLSLDSVDKPIKHTFTYTGQTAGTLTVQYVDTDTGAQATCGEGTVTTKDGTQLPIVGVQKLNDLGVVGQVVKLGQHGAKDGKGVLDLLQVPKDWKLVHKINVFSQSLHRQPVGLMMFMGDPVRRAVVEPIKPKNTNGDTVAHTARSAKARPISQSVNESSVAGHFMSSEAKSAYISQPSSSLNSVMNSSASVIQPTASSVSVSVNPTSSSKAISSGAVPVSQYMTTFNYANSAITSSSTADNLVSTDKASSATISAKSNSSVTSSESNRAQSIVDSIFTNLDQSSHASSSSISVKSASEPSSAHSSSDRHSAGKLAMNVRNDRKQTSDSNARHAQNRNRMTLPKTNDSSQHTMASALFTIALLIFGFGICVNRKHNE